MKFFNFIMRKKLCKSTFSFFLKTFQSGKIDIILFVRNLNEKYLSYRDSWRRGAIFV
jgi:hypothetical protein